VGLAPELQHVFALLVLLEFAPHRRQRAFEEAEQQVADFNALAPVQAFAGRQVAHGVDHVVNRARLANMRAQQLADLARQWLRNLLVRRDARTRDIQRAACGKNSAPQIRSAPAIAQQASQVPCARFFLSCSTTSGSSAAAVKRVMS
jgi:hypothetical protein